MSFDTLSLDERIGVMQLSYPAKCLPSALLSALEYDHNRSLYIHTEK